MTTQWMHGVVGTYKVSHRFVEILVTLRVIFLRGEDADFNGEGRLCVCEDEREESVCVCVCVRVRERVCV